MDGFVIIPKFILRNPSLTPCSIITYLHLLHYDRDNGNGCYCRKETLSKLCNISLFQVRQALKLLEKEGIISIHRRYNGLTDVIRINPDCRQPSKRAPAGATRKPRSRVSVSSQPLDVKKLPAPIKKNKTITNNTIGETRATEVEKTQKNKGKQEHQPPTSLTPNRKHAPLTKTILDAIQPRIRPQSFTTWFADIFVENETDSHLEIVTPGGIQVAGWINEHYLTLLEDVAGKQVRLLVREGEKSWQGKR